MKYLAVLLVVLGAAVFSLPFWLPAVSSATVEAEAFARAGQVGGGLAGIGIVMFVIAILRRR